MKAAKPPDDFMAGPEEKVISVGENDRRVDFVQKLLRGKPFDSRLSADGHENRGGNRAVGGVQEPRARARNGALSLKFEMHYFQRIL
jgi:hypothetical protein